MEDADRAAEQLELQISSGQNWSSRADALAFAEHCSKTAKDANRRAVEAAKMLLQSTIYEDRADAEREAGEAAPMDEEAKAWTCVQEKDVGLDNLEKADDDEGGSSSEESGAVRGKGQAGMQHQLETGKGGQNAGVKKENKPKAPKQTGGRRKNRQ